MSALSNHVTEAYLARCEAPDGPLRHARTSLELSETKRLSWPRLLPRPIMVDDQGFLRAQSDYTQPVGPWFWNR